MQFPINATTVTGYIIGNNTTNIVEASSGYDVHVLYASIINDFDTNLSYLFCDSEVLSAGFGTTQSDTFSDYVCDSQTLYFQHYGGGATTLYYSITYTTTTPQYPSLTTGVDTLNGFTYGEMVISTFLFFVVLFMFFGGLWDKIIGVKQKRNMANTFQFNSPEGKGDYID